MTDTPLRILLAEDDPVSGAFLQAALERTPARVDVAPTCSRARDLARAHRYALLAFDANLPDGQGDALLADMRAGGVHAPAIAHTASREPADHARLLAAGFLEVLAKPLSAAGILAAARTALGLDGEPVRHHVCEGDAPLWDDAAALQAVLGNEAHLHALRSMFVPELRCMRLAVADAVRTGDHAGLQSVLHRLRASCGFVGAAQLRHAADALADGDPAIAWPAFDEVVALTLAQSPVDVP